MAKVKINLEPVEYILKEDRELPKEEQTIFYIKPLTCDESMEIQNALLETELRKLGPKKERVQVQRVNLGAQMKMALNYGLERIENLKTETGVEIKYTKQMQKAEKNKVFDILHPSWRREIVDEILTISGLSEEEEKN